MNKFLKFFIKALLIVVLFFGLYGAIMIVAYDYFYEYPKGFLDTMERADDARFYRVNQKIDLGNNTLLYFARSNNGVGDDVHVGTLVSDKPEIIANFFCTSTSSLYLPVNTISYLTTEDTNVCYLFGSTTDQNTVKVTVTFTNKATSEKKQYEMNYKNWKESAGFFYITGFEKEWADCNGYVIGYNENNGITFQYACGPIEAGGYAEVK